MKPKKAWLDTNREGGQKIPQGKGERSIVCHVGSENGFVQPAQLIFCGKKSLKDSDYHTEMNSDVFWDWIERRVFCNIPRGSVVVIGRATYHLKLTRKSASSNLKKVEFAEWLVEKKIKEKKMRTVEDYLKLTRVELAALCKKHKPKKVYEVQVLAKKYKIDVLFLPVGYPELNSIEMVWASLKDYVKKKNVDYSLADCEKYSKEFFDSFNDAKWLKYINHVKKVEDHYLRVADDIPVSM